MRLFDPELNPEEIAAQKRFPRRTEYFARGEMSQRVSDALRTNASVSANDLAAVALAEKGFNATGRCGAIREPLPSHALSHGPARSRGENRSGRGIALETRAERAGFAMIGPSASRETRRILGRLRWIGPSS